MQARNVSNLSVLGFGRALSVPDFEREPERLDHALDNLVHDPLDPKTGGPRMPATTIHGRKITDRVFNIGAERDLDDIALRLVEKEHDLGALKHDQPIDESGCRIGITALSSR